MGHLHHPYPTFCECYLPLGKFFVRAARMHKRCGLQLALVVERWEPAQDTQRTSLQREESNLHSSKGSLAQLALQKFRHMGHLMARRQHPYLPCLHFPNRALQPLVIDVHHLQMPTLLSKQQRMTKQKDFSTTQPQVSWCRTM